MTEDLLDIMREIVDTFDSVEDIETKLLEDVKSEIEVVIFERVTTINTLADMWDDSDGSS